MKKKRKRGNNRADKYNFKELKYNVFSILLARASSADTHAGQNSHIAIIFIKKRSMYAFIIYLHKCLVYAMQNATHLICKSESGVSLEKSHKVNSYGMLIV